MLIEVNILTTISAPSATLKKSPVLKQGYI